MINREYIIPSIYLILLVGFFHDADPNGGAVKDFSYHNKVMLDFAKDFFGTFQNYDAYATRHSPFFYSIISFFYKFEINVALIRLILFHIAFLLPIIFYKCLEIKYKNIKKIYLIHFSVLLLLSPTFWSLSIWPDSRLYGLLVFCLSIFFYLKFEQSKLIFFVYLCIFSYALSSYISPNFALFSIFFFYKFFKKLDFYNILKITFFNLLLAFPAFAYLINLDNLFFLKTAVPSQEIKASDFFNISNKILIISSIIFFYLIPFLLTRSLKFNKLKIYSFTIISIVFIFLVSGFDYNFNYTGGGIFFKFSQFFFKNNYLFHVLSFISLFTILSLFKSKKGNFLILILLFLSNPQYTIYHKYYDPLLYILIFLLFDIEIKQKKLFSKKTVVIFYLFTSFFLIINFFKP